MFDSIRGLVNVPIGVKKYLNQSGTGVKQYSPVVPYLCLPVAEVVTIKNSLGKEIVSATQLYVDGPADISELDQVLFEGKMQSIEKITTFYDKGLPDIKVVYL